MGDHEDPAASDMPPASRAANVEPAVEYVSIDDQIPSVVGDLISAVEQGGQAHGELKKDSLGVNDAARVCSICQEPGHNKRTCPRQTADAQAAMGQGGDANGDKNDALRVCGMCGEPGHNRRTCVRQTHRDLHGKVGGVGAAQHMSLDKDVMRTCRMCGQPGHNKRTCPRLLVLDPAGQAAGEDGGGGVKPALSLMHLAPVPGSSAQRCNVQAFAVATGLVSHPQATLGHRSDSAGPSRQPPGAPPALSAKAPPLPPRHEAPVALGGRVAEVERKRKVAEEEAVAAEAAAQAAEGRLEALLARTVNAVARKSEISAECEALQEQISSALAARRSEAPVQPPIVDDARHGRARR